MIGLKNILSEEAWNDIKRVLKVKIRVIILRTFVVSLQTFLGLWTGAHERVAFNRNFSRRVSLYSDKIIITALHFLVTVLDWVVIELLFYIRVVVFGTLWRARRHYYERVVVVMNSFEELELLVVLTPFDKLKSKWTVCLLSLASGILPWSSIFTRFWRLFSPFTFYPVFMTV